jgi:hypothetical protein
MKDRNIDRLFDQMEILDRLYRYCSAADRSDPPGMLGAFSEDCTVNYDPAAPVMRSRQELSDMLHAFLGAVISGSHYVTNPIFEFIDADEALLGCYMYSWQRFAGYPAIADVHRWGRYEIRLRRTDGEWLITHMRLLSAGEYGGDRIAEQMSRGPVPILDFA